MNQSQLNSELVKICLSQQVATIHPKRNVQNSKLDKNQDIFYILQLSRL